MNEQELFCYEESRKELIEVLSFAGEMTDERILQSIEELVLEKGRQYLLSLREKELLRRDLFYSVRKLDVIQPLVDDPLVTEIMVNGYQTIFYEKNGEIRRYEKHFADEERLHDIIRQIAGRCNRVVNEQMPIADARLENGDRVNIVLPPVAVNGAALTIRRFPEDPITMEELIRRDALTREAADFLKRAVAAGYTVIVGGGTSTGKTTFLNALSGAIPKGERIVTIEDNAELNLKGIENLVSLEARGANLEGSREITIRDLIRTALRMRPNRIIVGEVRGQEAGDFLTCLNTGHSGSLGTVHTNSARDMVGRLEMMVRMGADLPIGVIREQIAAGIDLIVQLGRDANGKRSVSEIAEVTGIRDGEVLMHDLYAREKGVLERKDSLICRGKMEEYERIVGKRSAGPDRLQCLPDEAS